MSETRDTLEEEIGARRVGTIEIDGKGVPLALPANDDEVLHLLGVARARGWRVLPVGAGTKLAHGAPFERPRFAIGTLGLTGVVAFERGDGTITARAGTSMAALAGIARAAGSDLSPLVARAERATLGGVIASGTSGLDRLRRGPTRHQILGTKVALADGTIAKSGGRLVKNVTGFDLHRLHAGSRGGLCVVLEASMRLHPAPEREIVVSATHFGRDAALAAARDVLAFGSARPLAVLVENVCLAEERWSVHVVLAGRADPVLFERESVARILGTCETLDETASRERILALRDVEVGATARVAMLPATTSAVLGTLDACAARLRLRARLSIQPGIATIDVRLSPLDGSALAPEPAADWARALSAVGAEVELRAAPLESRREFHSDVDVPASARALGRRIEAALDPEHRFARAETRAPGARPSG